MLDQTKGQIRTVEPGSGAMDSCQALKFDAEVWYVTFFH
jgi:hypothetical protein